MKIALSAFAALAILVSPAAAQTTTAPAPGSTTVPDAKSFVATAGVSNLFEIQSSRLALLKASKPAVKQFAQMMVDERTRVADALTVAAQTANETVPPQRLRIRPMKSSWDNSTAPATSSPIRRGPDQGTPGRHRLVRHLLDQGRERAVQAVRRQDAARPSEAPRRCREAVAKRPIESAGQEMRGRNLDRAADVLRARARIFEPISPTQKPLRRGALTSTRY